MKRSASVYYEETVEAYLEYHGDLLAYQNEMFAFVIPSMSQFLLKHMHALNAFLDDIYASLYEKECTRAKEDTADRFALLYAEYDEVEEERIALRDSILNQLELSLIYNTVFRWHGDVMTRKGEPMTGAYAVAYFASWGACARTFHLFICSSPDKIPFYAERTAKEHPYCQIASKRAHVIVSVAPLIEYSVDDLWNGVRIITSTLYQYNFSPSMRAYMYALFFRYADLLASEQPEDKVYAVFNNPLFVIHNEELPIMGEDEEEYNDAFDAFKKLSISANSSYSLHNDFMYEGEAIFYHQLYRIKLSDDLIRYHRAPNVAITIRYTQQIKRNDILKATVVQWHAMCSAVAKNTFLRQTLVEMYTNTRTDMHLYHGDKERYKREFPTSAADARDILQEARPLEMAAIVSTQSVVLGDLLNAFKKEYMVSYAELFNEGDVGIIEERVFNEGDEGWMTATYEQEALLLTKLSTFLYFQLQLVKRYKSMTDAFMLEELCTLQEIEERVFLHKKKEWPTFLKLMRIYYVIDTVTDKVFKSLFFAEAYFVWLCLSLRSELIKEDSLPPELLLLVKKLNTLIQC